jgi:hypothetical protein
MSKSSVRYTQLEYEQAINGVRATTISEAEFQRRVMIVASQLGWLFYHAYDPIADEAGFPDLVMTRRGRVIFAELKTEKGKVSDEQRKWLELLSMCPKPVEVYLWRPSMMEKIVETLK